MSYLGPEKSGNLHEHAKYTLEKGRMDYQNELENNRYHKAGSWWTVFISLGVIGLFFALVFLLG